MFECAPANGRGMKAGRVGSLYAFDNSRSEAFDVAGIGKVLGIEHIRCSADGGRDRGHAEERRLEQHVREPLDSRRQSEEIEAGNDSPRVAAFTKKVHVTFEPQLRRESFEVRAKSAVPDDNGVQLRNIAPCSSDRPQECGMV